MKIPFLKPNISGQDIKELQKSIKTGWLVTGEYTKKFERNFADYLGAKDAVLVSSDTAAMHLALILAGVKEGDEVITTPMSWVATSNIVLYQKARPVFVDVDPLTGIIDENKIEEKITDKTKAILIVHLYGQMVDMRKLKEISEKYKIPVIEDCAHSVESARDGIRPGELGFAACFSFHAAKNITSGQGGAYVTNNQADADKIRLLRRDGVINKDGKRIMLELGYKYDLTDFQAALLLGQLKKIKQSHKKRLKVISNYKKLCEEAGLDYVKSLPNSVHAGHMFLIKVSPDKRDFLRGKMAEAGIDTSIHYPPIHLEPFYRKTFGYKEGDFPNAEKFGASVITLPTYPSLTLKEQKYIFSVINKSLK